jgi:uncharacterized metal-binding protein YceD (DUF177 family)
MTEIEFSRSTRVEPLPRDGLKTEIEANAAERAALAKLNNLVGIERLNANFRIVKWRRGVRVEGIVSARVTQTCVVSLEPFDVDIDEPIDARFLPVDAKAAESKSPPPESVVDEDAPDPLVDGKIDLGVLAAEFLTLALDPYPRKPGAAFEPSSPGNERESPFSRLRAIGDNEEPD